MSSSSPFFSVIIPVYNREKLIQRTLDSVFEQTFDDYEVIVVDDGSTDRSAEVVEAYPKPVRVIRQENAGPGAARNTGLEVAEGEYIAFLDSDDRWFPWTLQTYYDVVSTYDKPAFVSGAIDSFSARSEHRNESPEALEVTLHKDFLAAARRGKYVSTNHALVRKEAFDRVGGFTSRNINSEDHDLAFRLGTARGFVDIQAPAMVAVRRHDTQATDNLRKTWEGVRYLLDQEEKGNYPDGRKRRWERRYLLCQHVRSTSVSLLREGYFQEAWTLYRRTVRWQLRFSRLRYVLGFPGLALWWQFGPS